MSENVDKPGSSGIITRVIGSERFRNGFGLYARLPFAGHDDPSDQRQRAHGALRASTGRRWAGVELNGNAFNAQMRSVAGSGGWQRFRWPPGRVVFPLVRGVSMAVGGLLVWLLVR